MFSGQTWVNRILEGSHLSLLKGVAPVYEILNKQLYHMTSFDVVVYLVLFSFVVMPINPI